MNILSYDFGTGGIKAALFDVEGKCIRDAFSAYDTYYPAQGFHEQRPEDWWRAVVESTRALGDVSDVTAIGISVTRGEPMGSSEMTTAQLASPPRISGP